jgi:hypothetical protein
VRDGTLCCSDAQACSFLFSALRSSLVFFFFFFFFVLESLLARYGREDLVSPILS